ncbi:hypothetical protein ACVDG3_06900 [Meridianimarinicoccus sp. RP-17]|uniref:hypothetical protein n=1 Tax=Meridianimarinicoccus zhengii TaxID=2056810 RepID=UPI000DABCB39|nr:hypothetical protein [Phycocomes zhengii]
MMKLADEHRDADRINAVADNVQNPETQPGLLCFRLKAPNGDLYQHSYDHDLLLYHFFICPPAWPEDVTFWMSLQHAFEDRKVVRARLESGGKLVRLNVLEMRMAALKFPAMIIEATHGTFAAEFFNFLECLHYKILCQASGETQAIDADVRHDVHTFMRQMGFIVRRYEL